MLCVFVCGCLNVSVRFVCDVLYGAVWCMFYGVVFVSGLFKRVCVVCALLCGVVWHVDCVVLCLCVFLFVFVCLFVWLMCDRLCDVVWFVVR